MNTQRSVRADLLGLVGLLAMNAAISAIAGAVTATSVGSWYPTLYKPSFTPPDWLFGPVWSALYILMAIAAWRVWRRRGTPHRRAALVLYGAQLTLNLAWSLLFFGLRSPGLGLVCIVLLVTAVAVTVQRFRRVEPLAGLLLVPYLLWVGFASALNAGIWLMNPA